MLVVKDSVVARVEPRLFEKAVCPVPLGEEIVVDAVEPTTPEEVV